MTNTENIATDMREAFPTHFDIINDQEFIAELEALLDEEELSSPEPRDFSGVIEPNGAALERMFQSLRDEDASHAAFEYERNRAADDGSARAYTFTRGRA